MHFPLKHHLIRAQFSKCSKSIHTSTQCMIGECKHFNCLLWLQLSAQRSSHMTLYLISIGTISVIESLMRRVFSIKKCWVGLFRIHSMFRWCFNRPWTTFTSRQIAFRCWKVASMRRHWVIGLNWNCKRKGNKFNCFLNRKQTSWPTLLTNY